MERDIIISMYPEVLLSKAQGKKSELGKRLIIEYLKFIAYNDKERLIYTQPMRLIHELDSENSYELDTRLLHNRMAYNFSSQLSIFKLIPINYPERILTLFKCIIYQETSMSILSELLYIIKSEYEYEYDSFIEVLIMRVGKIYNLYKDDSKFILDLLFLLNEKSYDWSDVPIFAIEEDIFTKDHHIENLDFYFPGVDQLPESIGLLSNLRRLRLSSTCIKELPESIGQLFHLNNLDLRYAHIKKFPESLNNLQELEEFYTPQVFERKRVPQSVIKVAKRCISKKFIKNGLNQDEALIMALSEILFSGGLRESKIDELGHIKELIFAEEYGMLDKARFPKFITDLKFLEKLCFYGYNLSRVPKSIGKLKNLRILDLGCNNFKTFPISIESLKKLEYLLLDYTKIKDWDFLRHFHRLKQLNLYSCGLSKIPEVIWSLTSLEHLDLGHNQIIKLSKSIGKLKSLKILFLNGNNLKEIPKEVGHLVNLEELWLSDNSITELPATISSLEALKKINLSYNKIKEIPTSIKNIKNLELII